jgi:hypothetical protein
VQARPITTCARLSALLHLSPYASISLSGKPKRQRRSPLIARCAPAPPAARRHIATITRAHPTTNQTTTTTACSARLSAFTPCYNTYTTNLLTHHSRAVHLKPPPTRTTSHYHDHNVRRQLHICVLALPLLGQQQRLFHPRAFSLSLSLLTFIRLPATTTTLLSHRPSSRPRPPTHPPRSPHSLPALRLVRQHN